MAQGRIKQFQLDPSISLGGSGITPGSQGDGILLTGSPLSIINVDSTVIRGTNSGSSQEISTLINFTDDTYNFAFQGVSANQPGLQIQAFGGQIRLNPKTGPSTFDFNEALYYWKDLSPARWIFNPPVQFNDQLLANNAIDTAADPSYSFQTDDNTGMYNSGANELSFSTNSTQRLELDNVGRITATTSGYEALVDNDDVLTNKKYVDDLVSSVGGATPTENTFTGASTITGLDTAKRYLVAVYGIAPSAGTGGGLTFGAVRVGDGATPGLGAQLASTGVVTSVNWPDGNFAMSHTFVVSPVSSTINGAVNVGGTGGSVAATAMTAVEIGTANLTGDINLTSRFVDDSTGGATGSASIQVQFLNGGSLQFVRQNLSNITPAGEWYVNAPSVIPNPGDYQVQLTVDSGSTPSGPTIGAWHTLSTSRIWTLSVSFGSSYSMLNSTVTASIRDVATQTIQDSATFNLSVERGGPIP